MVEIRPGGRRRIDRVLAPDCDLSQASPDCDLDRASPDCDLDGIAGRPLAEVRELRNDAAQEETDLSFLRRLLHARIDIVLAEQRRRTEGSTGLVECLATILASNTVAPAFGRGRLQTLEPSRADAHCRYVEALVADVDLSDIGSLSEVKLTEALAAYRAEEASVSQRRREVQAVVDALNAEIAARYRAGTASTDDLLARELFGAGDEPAGAGEEATY